jgi:hypothetical protein
MMVQKAQDAKKDVNNKEVEKSHSTFNLESEISKLKVQSLLMSISRILNIEVRLLK